MPKVSIVIRSRNDAQCLESTLKAILSQKFTDFEILVFDNDSSDNTPELLKSYPQIKVFNIQEGKYVPGKVLNFAVSKCKGEIVVFNNSDAIVQGTNWLANIVKPLLEGNAQAVYARQVCRPDADVWVRKDYENAFGAHEFSKDFFSMVSSAALAKTLAENPFDEEMQYSEDVFWARGLRNKGLKVLYVPEAIVEHSHNYTLAETRKRFSGEGAADALILGDKQNFFDFAKGLCGAFVNDFLYLLKRGEASKILSCTRWRATQKIAYYLARKKAAKKL